MLQIITTTTIIPTTTIGMDFCSADCKCSVNSDEQYASGKLLFQNKLAITVNKLKIDETNFKSC